VTGEFERLPLLRGAAELVIERGDERADDRGVELPAGLALELGDGVRRCRRSATSHWHTPRVAVDDHAVTLELSGEPLAA
jgi:hypothetical protein